jgi:hypothetical protein
MSHTDQRTDVNPIIVWGGKRTYRRIRCVGHSALVIERKQLEEAQGRKGTTEPGPMLRNENLMGAGHSRHEDCVVRSEPTEICELTTCHVAFWKLGDILPGAMTCHTPQPPCMAGYSSMKFNRLVSMQPMLA